MLIYPLRMRFLSFVVFGLACACSCMHAQTPRDFAIDLQASVADISPCITLSWTQRVQGNITAQSISRRLKGTPSWGPATTLTTTQTSYADPTALPGVEYEYWMSRNFSLAPYIAMGYISAGLKVPAVEARGKLLLLVDDTMSAPLAPEITQLKEDLAADGWTVQQITAARAGTAITTKALIKAAYDADSANVKTAYILGHVPVPYSGQVSPDGHGGHGGAWPADGYYGDMDGTWTDTTVNATYASSSRNWNIPGDGKFDQSSLPGPVELGVGRVDFYGLGRSPCAVDGTIETTLLRRYLHRVHDYRHKLGAYAAIPRRSLIRDGFGYAFGSEPFAVSGWAGAFTGVGPTIDEAPSGQWFYPAYAGGRDYLWGHGNGGGSSESAGSVGCSADFGHKASRVVFTSVFGSWHGDWDSDHNFMRSMIAGNATGDSLGLCCFWQGRPNWFVHSLGLGETLGYMTRISMNAGLPDSRYMPSGKESPAVHLGLMGDPALRIHAVAPPRGLAATSGSGQVNLSWAASADTGLQGYYVYRAATSAGPYTRLTPSALAGTTYTDSTATTGHSYTYIVRTLKLESAPGGTYQNLSVCSPVNITVSAGIVAPNSPSDLIVTAQSSAVNAQLTWTDNSSNETGFRIERKVNAVGVWVTLATVAAGVTSHMDVGPFSHGNVYFYRVVATGGAGDSIASNMNSFEASAGFIEIIAQPGTGMTTSLARTLTVAKNAGNIVVTVTRFGGGTGAVTVQCVASSSSAVAGTHFTATTSTLSWADGEVGNKTFTVPITNTATPQQARQFIVALGTPGGNARLGVFKSIAVLITDPTATLAAPWAQTMLGGVTYNSPAVSAEGVIGSTMIGGALGGVSESGPFIYQTRTGDGSLTVYIRTPLPSASWAAKTALMVRDSLSASAKTAGVVASENTGANGTRMVSRSSTYLDAQIGSPANLNTPCWMRLTRMGANFVAEQSANGTTWTTVGQVTVNGMPSTAYWGIFDVAGDAASYSDYSAEFNLNRYENVSFAGLPAPTSPDGVVVSSPTTSNLSLQWNTTAYSEGYRIERRTEGGNFTQIAELSAINTQSTQSFADSNVIPDTVYQYRVIAYNSTSSAPVSAGAIGVTPQADIVFTRTTNDPGGADATVFAAVPDGSFGTQNTLTVAGVYPSDADLAKTYLRFDITGLPGTIKTSTLNLSFLDQRYIDETNWYYMECDLLTTDTADVWDESALTWNNAPLNKTTGGGVIAPSALLGSDYIGASFPVVGAPATIQLNAATLNANIGENHIVTFVILSQSDAAQADWASREYNSYMPPTLAIILNNNSPKRPGFLTVTSGSGSAFNLSWSDGTPDEAGFQIERRVANGSWVLLTTSAANSTNYTDTTALPGVIYEYRVRSTNAAGSSSWATPAIPPVVHAGVAAISAAISSPDGMVFKLADSSSERAYVPTGFTYTSSPTAYVTGQTLSATIRNNYNGWLGMKFTVGASPLTVQGLGRWIIPGNTANHALKLVVDSTKADVPGGSAVVSTSGEPAGFKYAALVAPVTLAANTAYYLVSQEVSGGDQFYQGDSLLTSTGAATMNLAIWSGNGTSYGTAYAAGNCYVPVSFTYSAAPMPFVTGHGMSTLRNDFSGWLGMEITTGASPFTVNQLGRWVVPGNSGTHSVRLVEAATGNNLGTANVVTAGAPSGQFKYAPLSPAVTLAPNTSYYVLSQESAGGDQWHDFNLAAAGSASAYQYWLLANGLPMDESGDGSATATPASDGLPNLVKYALGLTPTVSGNGGRLSYGTAADAGDDYLSFTYIRPEPAPGGISYSVEAGSDLTPGAWSASGLVETGSTLNGGLRTITVRDSAPMAGGGSRFMRLKITQP